MPIAACWKVELTIQAPPRLVTRSPDPPAVKREESDMKNCDAPVTTYPLLVMVSTSTLSIDSTPTGLGQENELLAQMPLKPLCTRT